MHSALQQKKSHSPILKNMNQKVSSPKNTIKSPIKNNSHSNSPIKKKMQNLTATISIKVDIKHRRPQTVQSFSTNCTQSIAQSNRNIFRQINLRMKGVRCVSGKLSKGFVKDTATKLSIGSIPSNHETIINEIKHEKAFGSSQPRSNLAVQKNCYAKYSINQSQGNVRMDWKNSKKRFMASTNEKINEKQTKQVNRMKEQFYAAIQNEKNKLESQKINQSPSFSKKGYGSLISKQKRDMIKTIMAGKQFGGPGPGSYETAIVFALDDQMHRSPEKSSAKGGRIIGARNSPYNKKIKELICTVNSLQKSISPGPADYFNDYPHQKTQQNRVYFKPQSKRYFNQQGDFKAQGNKDMQKKSIQKRNCGGKYNKTKIIPKTFNNGWQSSFNTKVKRDGYIAKKNTPGPGQYKLDEDIIKKAKNKKKQQNQCNQQTYFQNQRSYKKQQHNKSIAKVLQRQFYSLKAQNSGKQVPGPGTYQHRVPYLKPLYERIKNSNNFIEGRIDRFGEYTGDKYRQVNFLLSQQDQQPVSLAPGSYDIVSGFQKAMKKRMIQSSAFMSQAKREIFADSQTKYGPLLLNSQDQFQQERKSYNLNIFNVWH